MRAKRREGSLGGEGTRAQPGSLSSFRHDESDPRDHRFGMCEGWFDDGSHPRASLPRHPALTMSHALAVRTWELGQAADEPHSCQSLFDILYLSPKLREAARISSRPARCQHTLCFHMATHHLQMAFYASL